MMIDATNMLAHLERNPRRVVRLWIDSARAKEPDETDAVLREEITLSVKMLIGAHIFADSIVGESRDYAAFWESVEAALDAELPSTAIRLETTDRR